MVADCPHIRPYGIDPHAAIVLLQSLDSSLVLGVCGAECVVLLLDCMTLGQVHLAFFVVTHLLRVELLLELTELLLEVCFFESRESRAMLHCGVVLFLGVLEPVEEVFDGVVLEESEVDEAADLLIALHALVARGFDLVVLHDHLIEQVCGKFVLSGIYQNLPY